MNALQSAAPQGEQQKAVEATDNRKQPGLMESSLGSLLQEIRPLRQELRGQPVTEGSRVLTLAASPGEPNPVAATTQNGDNLSSFSFEQKAESILNGLGEQGTGSSPTADGALFDAALTSNLHAAQALREGTHPLATSTTEAGTVRLSSGELLSENQVVDQVLQRIHLEGGSEISRIVIKMHPEELGEVKLALTLEKDKLSAQLLAQNQQVQEILEKHLPRLHEALNHQGLRLENIQVSVDSNRHFDREFFDKQRQSGSFRRDFNTPSGAIADEQAAIASMTTRRGLNEGLSLRV
ncbi:MAG: flagellar hook-length control protein FliK [Syntrophotaleaceae bacterium]